MPKTWFEVKAKAGDDSAEIAVFDEIGMWGVTAKDFIGELKKIDAKAITLSINSPGGSVFDALAMYNALRAHGATINVKVMGIAASAASLIAMAGNKIVMPENTFMMIHNPIGGVYGNAEDMREIADVLDKIGASLVSTYVARTGLDEQEVKDLLAAETWLTAAEAKDKGFADEVEAALKVAASFNTERLPENIKAVFLAQDGEPGDGGDKGAGGDGESGEGSEGGEADAAPTAEAIAALAASAGLEEFAPALALSCATLEDAKAAIAQAREVRALCAVAKLPDMAAKLIRAKATVAEARTALCDALADADEQNNVDSTLKSTNSKPAKNAQPAALKTADIWQARRSIH